MPNAQQFITLDELTWPVTYTWHMSVPWGFATLRLTVDYPDGVDDLNRTKGSIIPLWVAAVAPATSFLTGYLAGSCYCWKRGVAVDGTGLYPVGENGIFPAPRSRGLALVMQSGITDRQGSRRLIIPAVPRNWFDGVGQLTENGAGRALTYARALFGGLNGSMESTPFRWLMAFPEAYRQPVTGFWLPGFRAVESIRVCSYSVPVPDSSFVP